MRSSGPKLIRRLKSNQSGNVLVLTAMALPALLGAGGLAMDTIQWTLMQRQIQREADSAALAGAYAKAQGSDAVVAAKASLARDALLKLTKTPDINPYAAYAGSNSAVKVALTTNSILPFSSLFRPQGATIKAEATAAALTNGQFCVISLEGDNYNGAITVQGSSRVTMGCGFATNAKGSSALTATGSGWLDATFVAAVGGLKASSKNIDPDTVLIPYSVPQPDPLRSLPSPSSLPTPCTAKLDVASNTSKAFSPGCYQGGTIQGRASFSPGVYYIDGGVLKVNAGALVIGTGVTFILTSRTAATNPTSIATLDMNGGATVKLTAPSPETCSGASCAYADVLFYQDRRAVLPSGNSANAINGNANSTLQGAIYFPSQAVSFSGGSGMMTDCVQILARRVTFIGNSNIVNECPDSYNKDRFLGTRVYLVL